METKGTEINKEVERSVTEITKLKEKQLETENHHRIKVKRETIGNRKSPQN